MNPFRGAFHQEVDRLLRLALALGDLSGVCRVLQQPEAERAVAALAGQLQGGASSGIGGRTVHEHPLHLQQRERALRAVRRHGGVEGGAAAAVAKQGVGSGLQQVAHELELVARNGDVQHGPPHLVLMVQQRLLCGSGVRIVPLIAPPHRLRRRHEGLCEPRRFCAASPCNSVQRRLACEVDTAGVEPPLQQLLDCKNVALFHGNM
mmetsp:Transcript_47917/g.137541  ORF Transcript_47917/g.137541 Transcript_47917/m.137541 type:complete len:206 (+) Transcript_47917:1262-1879(+)